ncbi:MAG: hypothetical protein H7099_17140 [Gemmatimonadaceae bacterium]|nr:hypothetical protein [Gemmatimonadaceae bacterium]
MMMIPVLALAADTLLVRPVAVPAPWYSVATGILSIIVTLLLLGIAVALMGMARALKGAESNLGGRMQKLADEIVPLARNLNQIATQLSDFTTEARGELRRLSGTIGVVDDAVRDAVDAGESRLAQFGTLLDAVQDEAQATVASATGAMRGLRTGAGSMVSSLFRRNGSSTPRARTRRSIRDDDTVALDEDDVRARLAALEAAFAERDDDTDDDDEYDDDVIVDASARPARSAAPVPADDDESDDEWDDDEDDDDDDDDLVDDDDEDEDDDGDADDDIDFDDEEEDETDVPVPDRDDVARGAPRRGGPRIRNRGNA